MIQPQLGQILTIDQAMHLAIQVAGAGAAHVSPNPLVGCVILNSEDKLLATGYHQKYGESHAEVDAFKKLTAEQLVGAKLVVTLEPCAHQGKTPSCAIALAGMKLKKVVYGIVDPNPLVAGQGAQIIQATGIEVEEYSGIHKESLFQLCEVFLKNIIQNKPFIAAKIASSLDGQIALTTGESKWITGEASRQFVHELRSRYDAVLVGRNTIEIDNPSLNVRHPEIQKEVKLVILDPSGNLLKKIEQDNKYKFQDAHAPGNIIFLTNYKSDLSYQQIAFEDLPGAIDSLWEMNIKSVFIEGGAATYSEFFNLDLIDRLHLFLNCSVIGAASGLSWSETCGITSLDEKKNLKNVELKRFEQDIYITGTF